MVDLTQLKRELVNSKIEKKFLNVAQSRCRRKGS